MNSKDLQATLLGSCASGMSALRLVVTLQPVGGAGDKVAPPTHEAGKYAVETRLIDGKHDTPTVLLDSVQSQANRLEEALLSRLRSDEIQVPILQVSIPNREVLTSLSVPHRVHDAIFRDCTYKGIRFRESEIGKQISAARAWNATALFRVCPTALLFGTWDSQSESGANSAKFARSLVSEIIGIDFKRGVRTSSRIDPLGIKALKGTIFKSATGQWALEGVKGDKGKSQLYGKSGSPADINHGNIPPTITDAEKGEPGGVTFREAKQTAVISFAQLRKLKFPLNGDGDPAVDIAGRAVLAALGIYVLTLQMEDGYQLRSRCQLQPTHKPKFEWIAAVAPQNSNDEKSVEISRDVALETLKDLCLHAESLGLTWEKQPLRLEPEPKLLKLIENSDKAVED